MTTAKASERLVWVVEQLRVEPADKILEIGCGYGVAVSLVCEKLSNGRIAAIDRSPTMIAMAAKRNAAHVAAGRASFSTAALHEAEFGNDLFDKVFAIHVGLCLRSDPARDLAFIDRLLAPGGALYLATNHLPRARPRPSPRPCRPSSQRTTSLSVSGCGGPFRHAHRMCRCNIREIDMMTGGCLCGAVRYQADGEPAFAGFCYCRDCRRASGAGRMPFMGMPKASIEISGETRRHTVTGDSSLPTTRHFCPVCGSLVFREPEAAVGFFILYAGTLDDPSKFVPRIAIYIRAIGRFGKRTTAS